MNEQEYKELVEKLGKEAAAEIAKQMKALEKTLADKAEEVVKGAMTKEQFNDLAQELLKPINDQLKKLDDVTKEHGNKIQASNENPRAARKSFEQFIVEQGATINELRKSGKAVEFTATQLKDAGVTSISGSVQDMDAPPNSPYAPGIAGDLQLFDIVRNQNFILNQVNVGRTNQSRLAWINETVYEGAPAEVEEGNEKPLTQHKFKVELSTAKKIAAYIEITEEFQDDLPGLATAVRRKLEEDVIRGWDDAVQAAVIEAAVPYSNPGLNGQISDANYWDALLAMDAQVRLANFMTTTYGVNPNTAVMLKTWKDDEGRYLLPSFAQEIMNKLVQANKVEAGYAFAGDLKQYNVDVYKEFALRIGWINDNVILNKFVIVGEIRYHRYISDARKAAIVYDSLQAVVNDIDGAPHSS